MPDSLHDLRYALRSLRKSPGFAAVAILTLALGVGANTAIFSLINAVLLRPLPYEQPDRLVLVWESAPFFGLHDSPVAPANFVDWRARARSFEEIGAIENNYYLLSGRGNPEMLVGSVTTAGVMRALRIRPALGRIFNDAEDRPGAPQVALLSDGAWRRVFGADPGMVGKTVTFNNKPCTIIGVLAPGNEPPSEYSNTLGDVWTPLGSSYTSEQLANRGRHNWMVIARLRTGVSITQANAEMQAIGATLAHEYPGTNEKVGAFVAPLRDHFVSESRTILLILLGTVAFVLLIACSNLANLLLSRAADRSKEVAVRAALGAGGWDLARRFLMESLVLCVAGSALGLLLATSTFEFLAHLAPGDMTGLKTLALDWRVLAFTLGITVLTVGLFGMVPLLQVRRLNVNNALKQSARTLAKAAGSRGLRAALICSEVALAFVLLIGAGLFLQTLTRLRGVDTGFRTANLLTLSIPPSAARRDPAQYTAFQNEVLLRVRSIPGVVSAGFTNHIPLVIKGDISGVGAEGRDADFRIQCRNRVAGSGYLQTMGIPLRSGRDIDDRDAEGAPRVVLVNEALARTAWPNQEPIGRRLIFERRRVEDNVSAVVVGVVGDIHQSGLDVPSQPEFYVSALQAGFPMSAFAIHSKGEPASLASAVRRAIWSIDPEQPIMEMATMEEILDKEVLQKRVQTTLLTAFAGLALLLAAIGLYGVLSNLVGQQVPEIGLRMALGASPSGVLRSVVGRGLKLAVAGVCVGAAGALGLSRLLATLLFGVKSTDPATYAFVATILLATAALASYLPARRAMSVDPIEALRDE